MTTTKKKQATPPAEKFILINDVEIDSKDDDFLGFTSYAKIIAQAGLNTRGPFTIGIFGEWGTGKTSLLRLVQRELEKERSMLVVWFNAWQYENEENLLYPLLLTIIKTMNQNKSFLDRLKDDGVDLLKALVALTYSIETKAKLILPQVAEAEVSLSMEKCIDKIEALSKDDLLNTSKYFDIFERLSSLQPKQVGKIAIIIDDLDRCNPIGAIHLLESIKLILTQPGFLFILGLDKRFIEGVIKQRYEKEYGINNFDGSKYLDKLVQLPFYIPSHIYSMEEYFSKKTDKLDTVVKMELVEEIQPVISSLTGNNPRATIRLINNILIDRSINQLLNSNKQMEIIKIGFFAVSRFLQDRFSLLYDYLIRSEQLCQGLNYVLDAADFDKMRERIRAFQLTIGPELANKSIVVKTVKKISHEDKDLTIIQKELLRVIENNDFVTVMKSPIGKRWLVETYKRNKAIAFFSEIDTLTRLSGVFEKIKKVEDNDEKRKIEQEFQAIMDKLEED